MIYGGFIYSIMGPLLWKMSKLKIQERAGIVLDMKKFIIVTMLTYITNVPVVVMVDYGILDHQPYYYVISMTLSFCFVAMLYIG